MAISQYSRNGNTRKKIYRSNAHGNKTLQAQQASLANCVTDKQTL
jgi:hypothetical protein